MTFVPLGPDSAIGVRTVFNQECPIFEERHLLVLFVGKDVTIKNSGIEIRAKLLWFEGGSSGPQHRPCALILRTADKRVHVMRDWQEVRTNG